MTQPTLDEKYAQLRQILRDLESVAVAFSTGVDSTLVLKVALDTLGPTKVVAVTGRSDSLARAEFDEAGSLAAVLGAEHVVLDTDEFDNPNYLSNPTNRCYFCKTTLYTHLERFIAERGLKAIVNGINADDLGDYRPGIEAAREHGVRCPAAEAGLTKADIRELSRRLGLPTFDKPASPCLSSRVQYGEHITPQKLRMIEAGEAFLHEMGIR
ncbi:MAG: ATP-dependent sacrificial sulfur transferase LarE, partial [Planctomycetota bacterium]